MYESETEHRPANTVKLNKLEAEADFSSLLSFHYHPSHLSLVMLVTLNLSYIILPVRSTLT